MYLHIFFFLLSSRSASCFLLDKETSVLQNRTIIRELLCLLEAENGNLKAEFTIPTHIKSRNCAYNTMKRFMKGLEKIPDGMCTKRVKAGMERLRDTCPLLKKSSPHGHQCSEEMKTDFQHFKTCLEKFLKWINQSNECGNMGITGLDLYADGKCRCPDPRRYQKGSL